MKRKQEPLIRAHTEPKGSIFRSYLIVIGGLMLVLFYTLYPFHFEQFGRLYHLHRYFGGFNFGGYSRCCTYLAILEPLANVVLFLPFSFGLTSLVKKSTATWMVAFVVVLVLCFGLSFTIEILQVFQPRRSPSFADVLMNSIGGVFGFLCFRVWALYR